MRKRKLQKKIKKSDEEFALQVQNANPNIKLLGTYINNKISILVRCTICGNEWKALPRNLLKEDVCKCCKNKNI